MNDYRKARADQTYESPCLSPTILQLWYSFDGFRIHNFELLISQYSISLNRDGKTETSSIQDTNIYTTSLMLQNIPLIFLIISNVWFGIFYNYSILSWHFIRISGMNPKNCSLVCHCKTSQDFLIFLLYLSTISNICSTLLCHFIVQSHSVLRLFLLQFFNWLTCFS